MFKNSVLFLLLLLLINCGGGGGGGTDPNDDPPVARFSASPISGEAPLTVTFVSNSENATSYAWDFNNDGTVDGSGSTGVFTYENIGTYSVSLTVEGPGGSDVNTKEDLINVTSAAPTVEFSTSPDEVAGIVPHRVHFTNSSSNYNSLTWNFGDGNSSSEENPTHLYESSGNFDVSLTVSGDGGEITETKSSYIIVNDLQTPGFILDPKYIDTSTGSTITFDIKLVGVTGLAAAQATINYDNNALEFVSATAGDFLEGDNAPLFVVSSSPGIGRLSVYSSSLSTDKPSVDGDGVIASINFIVNGSSDTTIGWGADSPGAGGGGAGNYMLDINGQAMTFNDKDNLYIFVD